jgi:hypothetical protein
MMSCLTDEQIVSLVVGAPCAAFREHVSSCQACADRLAEVQSRMARLEAALTATDPAHEAGRVHLLTALREEPVPVRPLFWRIVMNRRNWAVTAAAAMIAIVAFLGWPGGPRAAALAEALRPFKEAKAFACDMVTLKDGKPGDTILPAEKRGKLKTRLTWAAPGSLRFDTSNDGKPLSGLILPHGKPGIIFGHTNKEYTPLERKSGGNEEAILQLINTLAAYTPAEKKPDGTDDVAGLKAPRFDLVIADADKRQWHYRIWVHPTTMRVLRVEFALLPGKELTAKDVVAVRLDQFDWDVKTEDLFDTKPPAGYKRVVVKAAEVPDMMTKMIVASLKSYREVTGGYPKTEHLDGSKAAMELEQQSKKKLAVETVQGFVLVGVLQSLSKEAVYRGKTVGPDDKDKILFRWKLDDGQYRVIFGDLKAETVSSEKLKELEAK